MGEKQTEKQEMENGSPAGDVGGNEGSKFYVLVLTCFAAIGALLFGYDTGIVSGSMLLIQEDFNLTTIWKESIVSATIGAAAIFALIAGFLVDKIGRKPVIMIASFVFTIGAIVMAVSPTDKKEVLLVGRLIVGAGIGFASMSVPVYVAEAAPSHIRGALVTMYQLFITIGILISSLVAGAFSSDKENGWRYMLGLAGIPAVIQFIGFFFLPESPRWLVGKDRLEPAKKALMKIRGKDDVGAELKEIEDSVNEERQYNKYNIFQTIGKMLTTQPVRRALILGCLLQFFQQLCGINTVIYYSASILRMSGFPSEQAIWLACIPNAVNMLCTFIGIYAVERAGRRILTLASFVGIIIALVVLGTGFYLAEQNSPTVSVYPVGFDVNETECYTMSTCNDCTLSEKCGFCWKDDNETLSGSCLPVDSKFKERYATQPNNSEAIYRCDKNNFDNGKTYHWANDYCPTDYGWMSVLGLALFVIAFAPGLGPNPWTINSEIYPLWARGTGTSLATAVNWLANLLVSMTFLTLLETITRYGTFYLFCGISFLGMAILFFILPETKDRTLEEVEELFMSDSYRRKHKPQEKYGEANGAFDAKEESSKL